MRANIERLVESTDPRSALASMSLDEAWTLALGELLHGPDPDGALLRACRLPDAVLTDGPLPRALCRLLHQGSYPARLLQLVPEARGLLEPERGGSPLHEALVAELEAGMQTHGPDEALGRVRTREYLRMARRELEDAPLEEVGADLSTLAAACIEASLRHMQLAEQVAVFGMGKLGGFELNFLSDIDLVFVHADDLDEQTDGAERISLRELHERLRTLVRMLEGRGAYRPLFRVDLRLRPFGARGPLSMSVSATESYYERYGRPWERQAWLRARVVAGSAPIGSEMLRRLSPFVHPRNIGPDIFGEIAELMHRARRDAGRRTLSSRALRRERPEAGATPDVGGVDLKLDAGGIREVEFSVQALQLLHGGKNPGIRSTSTLQALDSLLAAGLVSDREHRDLVEAYRWFRRVEHRLQLVEGQQTHRLPLEVEARALLAARLADVEAGRGEALRVELERTLEQHRERVAAVARTMAGEPEGAVADDPHARAIDAVLDMGAPPDVRCAALRELGVRDPDEVEALLQHLHAREHGAFSERGTALRGAQNLLVACLDSADPDAAVARLVEFAAARPGHYAVWRFFAEPEVHGHDLVRLTAELFGTSESLSRGLIGFPVSRGPLRDESIGILQASTAPRLPDAHSLVRDFEDYEGDTRGLDASLLRFKHQQLVSIALHDLGRRPDPLEVGRSLSDLADLLLRVLARDLAAEFARDARLHGLRLGVFALGKYGMQAMDYGSDLDLIFVFDAADGSSGRDLQPHAIRAAQRLLSRLHARAMGMRLYEVDTRLRPSGRQGLLVSSLEGFRRYHGRSLPIWEKLALLRLRPITLVDVQPELGPPRPAALHDPLDPSALVSAALPGSLGALVEEIVLDSLVADGETADDAAIASAVRHLEHRIETELARETRSHLHAKVGRGGALELELLISALQLRAAREHPHVLVRGIVEAIDALARIGALGEEEAGALSAAYRFQRRFLNRLRMTHTGGGLADPDRFSQNSPRLVALARRMGLPSRQALLDHFQEAREVVRGAFDRHLEP